MNALADRQRLRVAWQTLRAAFGDPSSQPDGGETAASLARLRYQRAWLAGAMSSLARTVSVAAVLISLPVTLRYLGGERFGIWMTITSLTALLSFADFGLGNGLMNAVTHAHARGARTEVSAYVSSALLVLGSLALLGIVSAVTLAPLVPWNRLLAIDPARISAHELAKVMQVFLICLSCAVPIALVQKVQLAMQLGVVSNFWQLLASSVTLVAILLAVHLHASLAVLVLAALATPSVVLLVSAAVFWCYQQPQYSPWQQKPRRALVKELGLSGFMFFVIQLGGTFAFSSDTLIIAHVLGPIAVAQYSVMSRLTDGVVMISSLFLTPLWPAYADAFARRDASWIRNTMIASLKWTMAGTALATLMLLVLSRTIVDRWMGPGVPYSLALFVAGCAWAVVKATGNALGTFLNGLGWIGFQAIAAVVLAVMAIAAKILLSRYLGIVGIPVALMLAYLIAIVIPYAWQMPKILARIGA